MTLVPMLCGSSFHNKGVQKLLDCIIAFLPSPLDLPAVTGINPKTDEETVRHASEDDPFCGLAFKIATDPFVGRLCFVRIYSGKLDAGSYVLNSRSGKRERISRIYQMHSNKQNPMETVGRRHLRRRRFQGDPHGRHALRRERTDRPGADDLPRTGDRPGRRAQDPEGSGQARHRPVETG